jgi:hypothetical protein
MKKAKAPKVPVLESAFEVNLPKLIRVAKATGSARLVLDDGDVRTVAVLAESRLAVFLGGQQWVADIVAVQCLKGHVRPLKCPRAHEGNFQSLYYRSGELACRHCHALRYRTTLCGSATARVRIAKDRLQQKMGGATRLGVPDRQPGAWRKKYARDAALLATLMQVHFRAVRAYLAHQATNPHAASKNTFTG